MLDATRGPEAGSMYIVAPPERPYLEEVSRDPGKLRIAFTRRSPIGTPIDPEAVKAVEGTAKLLESLGHRVEEAEPAIDTMQLSKDFILMWFAQCAATVRSIKALARCGDEGFELDTLAMVAFGNATRAPEYVEGYWRWSDYTRALGEFHRKYDLLLTPTSAMPPARIGEIATPAWQHFTMKILLALGLGRVVLKSGIIEKMVTENLKWVPFTQLANLTGTPAMSVPLHWTASGLPIGSQFVAPHGGEGMLFRLAGQLEQAKPWFQRRPSL
jgi:amidase